MLSYDDRRILFLLIGLAIIRGIIYIAIVPPWLAPDEATHFEAIRLIGQKALWPTIEVYRETPMHPEMHASFEQYRLWQIAGLPTPQGFVTPGDPGSDPYIYYYPAHNSGSVVAADKYSLVYHGLLSPLSALSERLSIDRQLYLLRLSSLVLTALTIGVSWHFARTIFSEQPIIAVGLSSFLIFLPMYIHINTSVNVDVFTTLLVSTYFFWLAKIFCEGFSTRGLVAAGIFMGLAILTKPTALFIIPTAAAAVIIYLARRFEWHLRAVIPLMIALMAFTFLGGILLFQITNGGRSISPLSLATASINLSGDYYSSLPPQVYAQTVLWSFLSFWGLFGWANIPIFPAWVRLLALICLVVGIGVIIFLRRHIFGRTKAGEGLKRRQKDILLVLLVSPAFALMAAYTPLIASQSTRWLVPQSRYIFPAILPLALYFFLGFQQLVPPRAYQLTLPIWLGGLILFDTLALFYVIIPFIYG